MLASISATSRGDVITTLGFGSQGTISPLTVPVGSNVSFDLGVSFVPLAGTIGAPQSTDLITRETVPSCTNDGNLCLEVQIETTTSTLVSVFAEALAGNAPGPPMTFPTATLGTTTFNQTYPNPGQWEITTAGADTEQFNVNECTRVFIDRIPNAPSCMTIQTVSFSGAFDPGGNPSIFVDAVAASVPEPSSLLLLAVWVAGCWPLFACGRQPERAPPRNLS